VEVPIRVETTDVERIAVDNIARLDMNESNNTGSGPVMESSLRQNFSGVAGAIVMLKDKVNVLQAYLQAVQAGKIPPDFALIRDITSICNMLPALDTPQFNNDLMVQYNDTLLIAYLASMTKGTATLNEIVEKCNAAFDSERKVGLMNFGSGFV